MIITPTRELAIQIYTIVSKFSDFLKSMNMNFNSSLLIGGEKSNDEEVIMKS